MVWWPNLLSRLLPWLQSYIFSTEPSNIPSQDRAQNPAPSILWCCDDVNSRKRISYMHFDGYQLTRTWRPGSHNGPLLSPHQHLHQTGQKPGSLSREVRKLPNGSRATVFPQLNECLPTYPPPPMPTDIQPMLSTTIKMAYPPTHRHQTDLNLPGSGTSSFDWRFSAWAEEGGTTW